MHIELAKAHILRSENNNINTLTFFENIATSKRETSDELRQLQGQLPHQEVPTRIRVL